MLNTTDVIQAYGYISFGVGATDRIDNSQATLGIYSAELLSIMHLLIPGSMIVLISTTPSRPMRT